MVRRQFAELIDHLEHRPKLAPDSLETKDGYPGTYAAPFDDALLVYQVMEDHPLVDLRHIHWNKGKNW